MWPRWMSGRRGIDAELDAQRPALARGEVELGLERALGEDLDGADHEVVDEATVGHGTSLRTGAATVSGRTQGARRAARPPWMIPQACPRPPVDAVSTAPAQATPRKRWPVVVRSRDASGASAAQAAGGEGGALRARPVAAWIDEKVATPAARSSSRLGARLVTRALKRRVPPASTLGRELVALGVLEQQGDVLVRAGRLEEPLGPAQLVARVQHLLAAEGEDLDGRSGSEGATPRAIVDEAGDLLERRLRRAATAAGGRPARPAATPAARPFRPCSGYSR